MVYFASHIHYYYFVQVLNGWQLLQALDHFFYFFGFNNNKWKIFDFSLFLFASFEHKLLSVCNNKEYALFSTGTRTVR
jgi:hypothetical protein